MPERSTIEQTPKGEIVVYQPDETIHLEVRFDGETVWLSRQQIAQLFGRDVKTIGKHIANALVEELRGLATVAKFATVQIEGGRRVVRQIEHYSLDIPQGERLGSSLTARHKFLATRRGRAARAPTLTTSD